MRSAPAAGPRGVRGRQWREKAEAEQNRARAGAWPVELATNLREVFTITEKAPFRTFPCLKVQTCPFTLENLLKTKCCHWLTHNFKNHSLPLIG